MGRGGLRQLVAVTVVVVAGLTLGMLYGDVVARVSRRWTQPLVGDGIAADAAGPTTTTTSTMLLDRLLAINDQHRPLLAARGDSETGNQAAPTQGGIALAGDSEGRPMRMAPACGSVHVTMVRAAHSWLLVASPVWFSWWTEAVLMPLTLLRRLLCRCASGTSMLLDWRPCSSRCCSTGTVLIQ